MSTDLSPSSGLLVSSSNLFPSIGPISVILFKLRLIIFLHFYHNLPCLLSSMSRNTRSKTTLNEQKNKDPNSGIFSNTNGRVSETYHLDWSRIYSIFYNDDFSGIQHDHPDIINISKSQIHAITSRPSFMHYTDTVK